MKTANLIQRFIDGELLLRTSTERTPVQRVTYACDLQQILSMVDPNLNIQAFENFSPDIEASVSLGFTEAANSAFEGIGYLVVLDNKCARMYTKECEPIALDEEVSASALRLFPVCTEEVITESISGLSGKALAAKLRELADSVEEQDTPHVSKLQPAVEPTKTAMLCLYNGHVCHAQNLPALSLPEDPPVNIIFVDGEVKRVLTRELSEVAPASTEDVQYFYHVSGMEEDITQWFIYDLKKAEQVKIKNYLRLCRPVVREHALYAMDVQRVIASKRYAGPNAVLKRETAKSRKSHTSKTVRIKNENATVLGYGMLVRYQGCMHFVDCVDDNINLISMPGDRLEIFVTSDVQTLRKATSHECEYFEELADRVLVANNMSEPALKRLLSKCGADVQYAAKVAKDNEDPDLDEEELATDEMPDGLPYEKGDGFDPDPDLDEEEIL